MYCARGHFLLSSRVCAFFFFFETGLCLGYLIHFSGQCSLSRETKCCFQVWRREGACCWVFSHLLVAEGRNAHEGVNAKSLEVCDNKTI